MNQDKVRDILLATEDATSDFTVIFSGKKSSKVNGLYKPESREIILHNRNFEDDNQLLYTALHEYAHHLHSERSGGILSPRAHGPEFWHIFHSLLEKAQKKKLYHNVFEDSPELDAITKKLKTEYLAENGKLMRDFGGLLIEAEEICEKIKARFDDYVDRVLGINRVTARTAMKLSAYNINPALGYDNMKLVSGIRQPEKRAEAERALLSGKSPDFVKTEYNSTQKDEEPTERLKKEKLRLERTIKSLRSRLAEVEAKLKEAEE